VKISEVTGDRVDHKTKVELIKLQEEAIKKEQEEMKTAEELKKQEELKKMEEEILVDVSIFIFLNFFHPNSASPPWIKYFH